MMHYALGAIAVLLAWVFWIAQEHPLYKRVIVPSHLENHPALAVDDVLTTAQADQLMEALKFQYGALGSNVDDGQNITHEHIGEAVPISPDGSCRHPYMVPSKNRELCLLANRVDIGRHFILAGGAEGKKERYFDALVRLLSFGLYIFNPAEIPVVQTLFSSEKFLSTARKLCPPDQQVIDPFQFNFIVQVPGQSVATHLDGVWFWNANRFQIPQWLLAVMAFSGIFKDDFVNQVQFVTYFHKSAPTSGGDFFAWTRDGSPPTTFPATPLSGLAVDGSKTMHSAGIYHPERNAPPIDKSKKNQLVYDSVADRWDAVTGNQTVGSFPTGELRCSLVFRARCFASEEAKARFNDAEDAKARFLGLEEILSRLSDELLRRGKLVPEKRVDLAVALLDTFITYPYSYDAFMPLNYCALGKLIPAFDPLLSFVC